MTKVVFMANNNIGPSQSGGDTIFLEFIKNWQKKLEITLFGSAETKLLTDRYHLDIKKFIQTDSVNQQCFPTTKNIVIHQIKRSFKAIISVFKNRKHLKSVDYIYSVSDFYPDLLPALIVKLFHPKVVWLAGYYLVAPPPWQKTSPYYVNRQIIKNIFYWFFQLFSRLLVNLFADTVLITSEPDKIYFSNKKIVVVQGGVDIAESKKYLKSKITIPVSKRRFDAVFIGRLHPQKGVLEIVDIWQKVVQKLPGALLAIIGDGQLERDLKLKIKNLKLSQNIVLFGFQTGNSKYNIFKQSKIVVHPAIFDSGGMAAAEAMAWGLPGVSFDLPALKTYYPKGMIKTACFDLDAFATNIVQLLSSPSNYKTTSQEAIELITNVWDWSKRSNKIFSEIFNHEKV